MEECLTDPSFIYYLIDNMEDAVEEAENDIKKYLEYSQEKTLRKYLRTLKDDLNNKKTMNLLQRFSKSFRENSMRNIMLDKKPKMLQCNLEINEESSEEVKVSNPFGKLNPFKSSTENSSKIILTFKIYSRRNSQMMTRHIIWFQMKIARKTLNHLFQKNS